MCVPPDQRVVKVLSPPKSQHKLCGVWILFKSVTDTKFESSGVTFLRLMPRTGLCYNEKLSAKKKYIQWNIEINPALIQHRFGVDFTSGNIQPKWKHINTPNKNKRLGVIFNSYLSIIFLIIIQPQFKTIINNI